MAGKDPEPVTGNLLEDIAQAYVLARGLPPSAVVTVMQMVGRPLTRRNESR